MAQQRRYGRQKNVLMSPETEDRVLLLSEDRGTSDSAIMRDALLIGLDVLDPNGEVSRYRDPARRELADGIRRMRAKGGKAQSKAA